MANEAAHLDPDAARVRRVGDSAHLTQLAFCARDQHGLVLFVADAARLIELITRIAGILRQRGARGRVIGAAGAAAGSANVWRSATHSRTVTLRPTGNVTGRANGSARAYVGCATG